MIRTYKPSQIADAILAGDLVRETEFVLAFEVERLRALEAARKQLQAALDTVTRERDEARAALKPFAALFLWPDDFGDESIRADEDWSDEQNDAQLDDKWVRRGDIRAARKALEAKP